MSNEVRDAWNKLTAGETFSFTADGVKTWAYCFEKFFEQFEGYKLTKEPECSVGWFYEKCGIHRTGDWCKYRPLNTFDMKVCMDCFQKLCPEPVALPLDKICIKCQTKTTNEHVWHPDPEGLGVYLCKSCFDKQCPELAVPECSMDRIKPNRIYYWDTLKNVGGVTGELLQKLYADYAKGCNDKADDMLMGVLDSCAERTLGKAPEPAAKPDHATDADAYLKPFPEFSKEKHVKPAEPEPWKELLDVCGSRYLLGQDRIEVEEARWKEQERRTSRMIAEAIKAERDRIVLSVRAQGYHHMANAIKEASK